MKLRVTVAVLLFLSMLASAARISAQVRWDNSGNSMLSGRFYFRELIVLAGTEQGANEVRQLVTQTGIITFDAAAGAKKDFVLSVVVPVTTLCPCSKEISARGAPRMRWSSSATPRTSAACSS